jgi:hypothetical protein
MSRKFYFIFRKKFLKLKKYKPAGIIAEIDGICYNYDMAFREVLHKTPTGKKILCEFFGIEKNPKLPFKESGGHLNGKTL